MVGISVSKTNNDPNDTRLISNEDFLGKVYVVEFFFTTCPTICPIMNTNMKRLENAFGNRDDFGIASFTIDPCIIVTIMI